MRSFSVSEINKYIKTIVFSDIFLQNVKVEGEVCAFKEPSKSGNLYFEIKDSDSRIKCLLFDMYEQFSEVPFKEGDLVTLVGKIDVYEKNGTYQLIVNNISIDGEGSLYKKFLALKEKLSDEGVFELTKRPIPTYPKKIGIITSDRGAAINDVLNTIKRRYPFVKLLLYSVQVQGINAVRDIIEAFDYFDETNVDIVLLTRGGGSYEELSVFNDESLARRNVKSKHPTVSAIGHAEDFFITDFCADKRCDTPTASAEELTPDIREVRRQNKELNDKLNAQMERALKNESRLSNLIEKNIAQLSPKNKFFKLQDLMHATNKRLDIIIKGAINKEKSKLSFYLDSFKGEISKEIDEGVNLLEGYEYRSESSIKFRIEKDKLRLDSLQKRLSSSDLNKLFARGFSVTYNDKDILLKDLKEINVGDIIYTRVGDRTIVSKITEVID